MVRQGWRQLRLLQAREPVERVLRRPDVPEAVREKLMIASLARRYAHEAIGLKQTTAYTRYLDTHGRPIAWNLTACPKDSLRPKTWRFPIVGEVPYLGYLDEGEARRAQAALDRQGYDTELRPVSAWSSLGWFADPLTSEMLKGEVSRLVEVVIHEITHATIFLRGQVAFNESLAVFVGDQGALDFLAQLFGPLSPEVERFGASMVRRRALSAIVEDLYVRLQRLYASAAPREEKLRRREEEFRRSQQRFRERFPDPSVWGRFGKGRLNNAVLLNYGRYNQGIRFHELVYLRVGRDLGRLVAVYREAQRHCDPISRIADRFGIVPMLRQQH